MLQVLIIEDDVIIGMLLARILVGMGHEVIGVEGTEEGAVAAAARNPPGLILADKRLSAGSGQAAIKRIIHTGFVPHIWMSGGPARRGDAKSRGDAQIGVADLQKPFTEQGLKAAIAQVTRLGASATAADAATIGEQAKGGRPRR
ncbi:response regulator [Paeniroseomonas aquatica]|uniref:Response regulator n=1 Tax=Paeniroseomonas aquatica TaxID=373043 RepID=A0ABT8A3M5_9PROT|nr:response regulator [Paeniroseomonas aquatica]MDN3564149.1 response regulator [Paeniroseomonas aquatica]